MQVQLKGRNPNQLETMGTGGPGSVAVPSAKVESKSKSSPRGECVNKGKICFISLFIRDYYYLK